MIVFFIIAFGVPLTSSLTLRARHVIFPDSIPSMIAAGFCSLGGIVATYVESGHAGLKALARRCVDYRVHVGWWLFALGFALTVHVAATVIYGAAHGRVGPISPVGLFHRWWLIYTFVFGIFQGPLAEELGWRGFLLPRLLERYTPLNASLILGLVATAWHINAFFAPVAVLAWFTASLIAVNILFTVLFLHSRGSVLLAIVMHWSIVPSAYIARFLFPPAQEPPDWLRAVVLIIAALITVAITGRTLGKLAPNGTTDDNACYQQAL